jgi:hypothetical protein
MPSAAQRRAGSAAKPAAEGFIRLIDTAMCHYKQKLIDTDMSRFNLKKPRSLLS